MYIAHTRARPAPTSATASSQCADEVGAPAGERLGVVLAQVLLVPHLEAVVLHRGDDRADALELAVREDVAVDEPADAMVFGVRRAG